MEKTNTKEEKEMKCGTCQKEMKEEKDHYICCNIMIKKPKKAKT